MDFLFWNKSIKLTVTASGIKYFEVLGNEDLKKDMVRNIVNQTAYEILMLVDGTKTFAQIADSLERKYHDKTVMAKINAFFKDMDRLHNVKVLAQHAPVYRNIVISSDENIYPLVCSIEITNQCNLRCIHCYGNYGELQPVIMDLSDVKKILKDLNKVGVKLIEITGGEATTHPNIIEIIKYALSLNFKQVALLSNGINFTDELIQILIENRHRVALQVDLHSLSDEYLSWFTLKANTLEIIKNNILKLAAADIKMRVATMLTQKNIDEIEMIADWVHSLGISSYGIGLISAMGRASDMNPDLFIDNEEQLLKVNAILERVNCKYENFLSLIEGDIDQKNNCGCFTSHVVIDSNGDTKICTMDNGEYCNGSIGNAIISSIKELYDKNAEFISQILVLKAPKMNSGECRECNNKVFCTGCLIRGLAKAQELKSKGGSCLWYINATSEKIKEKLQI